MKKDYIFFIFSEDEKKFYYKKIEETPRLQIDAEKLHIIYTSLKNKETKSKIIFYLIDFDEKTLKLINNLVEPAISWAQEFGDGKYEYTKDDIEKVKATITSIINKSYYEMQEKNKSIVFFCSEILYSLIQRHKLKDGNKRTALSLILFFLSYCGLFLKFSKENYASQWENFLKKIVLRKTNGEAEEKTIQFIEKKIKKELRIKYSFIK